MKNMPNILTLFRIFFSLILFFLEPKKLLFLLIYIICGLTDILDGSIARKINAQSDLGAKLDSISDMILFFIILFKFIPIIELNSLMILWLSIILFIKICSIFILLIKFKEFGMIHTYMNKLTGLLIFIYPILNYFTSCNIYLFVIFTVASLTAIEDVFLNLTMNYLDLNKKSYFNIKKF